VPTVVVSFGIVAGVLIPEEDPISPVLDARATAHLAILVLAWLHLARATCSPSTPR
jgi:hypothetical protein